MAIQKHGLWEGHLLWHINCLKMKAVLAFVPPIQIGAADLALGGRQTALTEDSLYSRVFKPGSRHPVDAGVEV